MKKQGHIVLSLPPGYSIEFVLGSIKGELAWTSSRTVILRLFGRKITIMPSHQEKKSEPEYYHNDMISDEIVDTFVINIRDGVSGDDNHSNHLSVDSSSDINTD